MHPTICAICLGNFAKRTIRAKLSFQEYSRSEEKRNKKGGGVTGGRNSARTRSCCRGEGTSFRGKINKRPLAVDLSGVSRPCAAYRVFHNMLDSFSTLATCQNNGGYGFSIFIIVNDVQVLPRKLFEVGNMIIRPQIMGNLRVQECTDGYTSFARCKWNKERVIVRCIFNFNSLLLNAVFHSA